MLTLADTGLRVQEAYKLRRSDVDWEAGTLFIDGDDKQAVVRFSSRSMKAIKDYLSLRAQLDGSSGKQLTALPLFARHDKGAGKKIKPITSTTGRNIVAERVGEILGEDAVGIDHSPLFPSLLCHDHFARNREFKISAGTCAA